MEILFVCTGNTCRSPLAEVLLQGALAGMEVKNIQVASAGISVTPGSPASWGAQAVLTPPEDLSCHRSRQLDREMLARADLVLTMTAGHKDYLVSQFPDEAGKIFTLGEYAWGKEIDIVDPFGGSKKDYLRARAEIKEAVQKIAIKLAKKDKMEVPGKMMIALASDHGGYRLKEEIKDYLLAQGYRFKDYGCTSEESVDYPDLAAAAAKGVTSGQCELGIIICGTGQGMAIAANKIKGIRAAVCHDCYSAAMARAHNNANILTLGQRVVGSELAKMVIEKFLTTSFEGERHRRRLDKIAALEEEFGQCLGK